ncbi:hypothetical protein ACCS70_06080 [Rhizobium ruizarguesonis]|jgi:hypothetical protein|uniref:Uncharacterized protein n=1 Tax=Rhizobium ruizarguesonis TaxID=2081791 RepID=A0AAE8Q8H6_9HYPH|nr:hypothetical protein [Rhizobium ruizarguesonis]MBY5807037.1 hypothetical protein [Rhizobium leguminosarum]NKL26815.1 hypothetical protein [Rhizobium leguminosarum bv. viciae]QIO48326.1 hypothetical protein HA464_30580 [Rhizobium leguminosarum bv. trifolii]QJS32071.1 hypothetical protein RLTA1_32835 [Rhizobium leguminosarum bv. trifolii TA1]MBY5842230.1 hypothetical protein [Rhizobium leguminosarum]
MEQYALDQLKTIANVSTTCKRLEMTRRERLERWAECLERSPRPHLKTLHETEYRPIADRLALRDDGTPISVAFADPMLRAAGMESDSYGEAIRFFDLSDEELHGLVCFCHFGERVSAATVARRLRKMAGCKPDGFFAQLRAFFG